MAGDSPLSPTSLALQRSLRRALRKRNQALRGLEPDPIHDIRVALRRCRSLAEGFANLDPRPVWRKLLKVCKKQQRGLADLRDIQVMRGWLRRLDLASGPAGAALAAALAQEEIAARKTAEASLDEFPRKRWKRWLERLPARAQLIPANEPRLAEIALERLAAVRRLDRLWRRERTMRVWHRLRVGVKRFRYIVESFLPAQHAAWKKDLKRFQDLLGEGHDLDVLRAKFLQATAGADEEQPIPKRALAAGLRRIDGEIAERIHAYEQSILLDAGMGRRGTRKAKRGRRLPETVWDGWRAELARVAGVTSRGAGESVKSAASPARPVAARTHRSPGARRRISSVR